MTPESALSLENTYLSIGRFGTAALSALSAARCSERDKLDYVRTSLPTQPHSKRMRSWAVPPAEARKARKDTSVPMNQSQKDVRDPKDPTSAERQGSEEVRAHCGCGGSRDAAPPPGYPPRSCMELRLGEGASMATYGALKGRKKPECELTVSVTLHG